MSTATIETPAVSQPETKTLFMSRRRDLRLVKKPRYPILGPSGQKIDERPGEAIKFQDGAFRCPREGEVILEDGTRADAAEVHAWLENHRVFGDLREGFWRVDPTAPPVSRDELNALLQAATTYDEEALQAIIDQEREGWQRPDLLEPAEAAMAKMQEVMETARARADEQARLDAENEAKVAAQPTPPAEPAAE